MRNDKTSSFLRRAAAFLLALLLAVPTGYAAAGDRKWRSSSILTEGLSYYNTVTENAGSRIESFSLELSPYSTAYPILLQGSGAVYGTGTITRAVAYAQSLGYHVLGAVNTDFFSTVTGVPLGIVIEDGVYKSCNEGTGGAMAIVNGQVHLVDDPQVSLTVTNLSTGYQVQPHYFNKWRAPTGGMYLLNHDFSATSARTTDSGWFVRMRLVDTSVPTGVPAVPSAPDPASPAQPEATDPIQTEPDQTEQTDPDQTNPEQTDPEQTDPEQAGTEQADPEQAGSEKPIEDAVQPKEPELPKLTVNSTITLEVVELLHTDQAPVIGEDEYLLTASDVSGYISVFQSFQAGDRVTVTTSCSDPALSAAQWAGGVGDVMVRNGAVTDSSKWTYTNSGRAPRTALGVKADGTLVVYAVDGRQSGYSMGLSEVDLAQEMLAQGCQWAVNVDGGGSTAISVWTPGQEGITLRNKPSDGVQRGCATYLLLVTDDAGNGQPARLALKEEGLTVLAGAALPLPETAVLDSGLNILPIQAGDMTAVSGGLGTVENGVYTAGSRTGSDTLTMYSPLLAAAGSAQISIVDSLSTLKVSRAGSTETLTSMLVKPGESVQLAVTGTYWGRTALRNFSAVTWTVEGGVGTVDADGLFTMNENGGSGSITAHAGGLSQTIQVAPPYTHIDVPKTHWAYEAVEYCYSHGAVNGISTTEFGPNLLVTRGDFVLLFYRAAGQPAVNTPCTFSDVDPGAYYAQALAWAQSAGLASGGADGTFRPKDPATREDAFTILRQVLPLLNRACPEGDPALLDQFADQDQIADYAREPITALVALGIVNGKGTGVDPKGNLTRAEMATLLHKVLTALPSTDVPAAPEEPAAPVLPDPAGYTLTLDQTELSLAPAESAALSAVLAPEFPDAGIVWTSSNPAAAPVTQEGVVTNIHPSEEGTEVTITASWNGLSASCTVQCQPAVFIGTVVTAESDLNVRSGPGTDQPATGSLASGSKVVVVSITKNGWYHIHYLHKDGYAAEGYVSGDYLLLNRT